MEPITVRDNPKSVISTDLLRKKIRDYTLKERASARATTTDSLRFGLGEIQAHIKELSLTEKDVQGLAARIKRRKHATKEDMYRLSHAFLLSTENITAFVNTQGALQVLVKELTGSNFERQISAIECICNLSLGELHVCEKICNMCGSYLVTYLDSSEKRLKQTSLWTLSNLIATGDKSAEMLLKMEILRKLLSIYVCLENVEYCEDSGICLQLLCLKTKNLLDNDHYKFIIEKIMQMSPTSVGSEFLLQIIFNCEILKASNESMLKESDLIWLINFALHSLRCSNDMSINSNRLRVIYAIRTISNALASSYQSYGILRTQLKEDWSCTLSGFFEYLFSLVEKTLILEVLWLWQNLLEVAKQLNVDTNEIETILTLLPKNNMNVLSS